MIDAWHPLHLNDMQKGNITELKGTSQNPGTLV